MQTMELRNNKILKLNLSAKKILELNRHLHRAAEKGDTDLVENLINAGANINCRRNGHTVLHYASKRGWLEIVQILLKKGPDIEAKTANGDTPLVLAAQNGHNKIVELLVNAEADLNCSGSIDDFTVFHYASKHEWPEIVLLLLKKGTDIDTKNKQCAPVVFLAALKKHKDIVELLINAGADINCSFITSNLTLLYFAAECGWFDIVHLLLKKGVHVKTKSGEVSLLKAAEKGLKDIVELLVNAGVNINCTGAMGDTALHWASARGWFEVVQFLLEKGADIEAKCSRGWTCLEYACRYTKIEVMKYLINSGADVNVGYDDGDSVLLDIIRLLLRHSDIKSVGSLLIKERGAYLKPVDYKKILEDSFLKEHILQNNELCSQVIINEFNHKDLPALYKLPMAREILPRIEHMRIGNKSQVAHEVLQSVKHEMKAKGYCNVLKTRPICLKILSIKPCLAYCGSMKNFKGALRRSKRLAKLNFDNQQRANKIMRYY